MRHKYQTRAIVLARAPLGEANVLVTLLTGELGLVRARAQGLRKPGAKLAAALSTFAESDVTLVRGAEGWRVTNAVLGENWAKQLSRPARVRAGRISGLLLRLVAGEETDEALFAILTGFFKALISEEETLQDAAECLAALRILRALGLDAGDVPGAGAATYEPILLSNITETRASVIARVNRGIAASGL
jgi:recombinational DNA repair protein (RecF pathway)